MVGLRDFSAPNQPKHLRVYTSDGTMLANLPAHGATPRIAFSPDGQFVATAAEVDLDAGVKISTLADGKVVGEVSFPIEDILTTWDSPRSPRANRRAVSRRTNQGRVTAIP